MKAVRIFQLFASSTLLCGSVLSSPGTSTLPEQPHQTQHPESPKNEHVFLGNDEYTYTRRPLKGGGVSYVIHSKEVGDEVLAVIDLDPKTASDKVIVRTIHTGDDITRERVELGHMIVGCWKEDGRDGSRLRRIQYMSAVETAGTQTTMNLVRGSLKIWAPASVVLDDLGGGQPFTLLLETVEGIQTNIAAKALGKEIARVKVDAEGNDVMEFTLRPNNS